MPNYQIQLLKIMRLLEEGKPVQAYLAAKELLELHEKDLKKQRSK